MLPAYLARVIFTGYEGEGRTDVMLMMLVVPPVITVLAKMLVEPGPTARLSVEFVSVMRPIGAPGVPACLPMVIVPLVDLMAVAPPPLTMEFATSAPPLRLMVPAVPGVS